MRNDHDANCTYEGDNNVLVQQTSNWLLSLWGHRNEGPQVFSFPLGSVAFMASYKDILASSWTAETFQDITQLPGIRLPSYLFSAVTHKTKFHLNSEAIVNVV